jgi:hypothetical protein
VNKRTEHYLLAIVGIVILVLASYMQWSMDLAKYSIRDYFERDMRSPSWWVTIGIPFCAGLAYILAAAYGLMKCSGRRCSLVLLGVCFAVAAALALISGFGYFAAVALIVCLSLAWRRRPALS